MPRGRNLTTEALLPHPGADGVRTYRGRGPDFVLLSRAPTLYFSTHVHTHEPLVNRTNPQVYYRDLSVYPQTLKS